ncbi:MAG TPA: cupredoxin family copper-binding protein [Candidatus Saccharimonadales bacterium]|nr:cupredoxin family copper-binding protein [Candidatus Saccharimonadales bacterium]
MNRKLLGVTITLVIVTIIAVVAAVAVTNQSSDEGAEHEHGSHSHQEGEQATGEDSTADKEAVVTDRVTIEQYAFSPATITIKAGTTVTWTNRDSVNHTVTSDDGSAIKFDSGDMAQGQTYQFTFDQPGTYNYHCTPHPFMRGTVVVTE